MSKKSLHFSVFKILFICSFCCAITSCKTNPEITKLSFCYWKTTYNLDKKEDTLMHKIGVNHLYVRFFDVDWNPYENEALPVASIRNIWGMDIKKMAMTPSIFITNTVMEKSSQTQLDSLVSRVNRRICSFIIAFRVSFISQYSYSYEFYNNQQKNLNVDSLNKVAFEIFNKQVQEVLIDCDWTPKTRDHYFYFLKKLQQLTPYKITATLRLWQYKQQKIAGIPPVDRCLLMCYSMASPTNYKVENSISSAKDLSKYISNESYPAKLDIALPIFNWVVMFRNGVFKGLINNIDPDNYKNDTSNYLQIADNRFQLRKDMVIGNVYLRFGDELRIEQVSSSELEKMAKLLKKSIKTDTSTRVTFFSWDTTYIKQYGTANLKSYSNILHR
jgi:hypothetical protein